MACDSPLGCEMLSMGFTTFSRAYLRRDCEVYHPACEGGGEDRCVWQIEIIPRTAGGGSGRDDQAPEADAVELDVDRAPD